MVPDTVLRLKLSVQPKHDRDHDRQFLLLDGATKVKRGNIRHHFHGRIIKRLVLRLQELPLETRHDDFTGGTTRVIP